MRASNEPKGRAEVRGGAGPSAARARAQIGSLISSAMARVGRQGVVTMEESRTAEDNLYVVEGMQFDRGYISPYFVTDPERMVRRPARARVAQNTSARSGGRCSREAAAPRPAEKCSSTRGVCPCYPEASWLSQSCKLDSGPRRVERARGAP
jgi:hypothetical protein